MSTTKFHLFPQLLGSSFSLAPQLCVQPRCQAPSNSTTATPMSSMEIPSSSECKGSSCPLPSFDKPNNQELTQTRKFSRLMTMLYSSITNFLIKLPSELLQKISLSSVLSQDTSSAQDPAKTPNLNPTSNKSRMQIYRWLPRRKSKLCNNKNPKTDSDVGKSSEGPKGKQRISHINGKGIIRTVKAMNLISGNKDPAFRKHPNSVKSSQKAVMERDVSVSDAIAHCRLSFDGTNK